MDECTYSPQISPGNPNLTAMPDSAPVTIIQADTITLTYPFDTPTTTLVLRAPQFNDKFLVNKSMINRQSRGNELIFFRDTAWPKIMTINYNFEGLTAVQAQEALDFYQESLGKYIGLLTYESLIYKGLIINPQNPVSQETKSSCSYTLKLDFQGTLQI